MTTHYDVLGVTSAASANEIQRAYRREIARYHPDKVQHLGPELIEVAARKSTTLTVAYNVLRDPRQRAAYDEHLGRQDAPQPPAPPPDAVSPRMPDEFVRRATLDRLRQAVADEWQSATAIAARGFDLAVMLPGRRGLFQRATPSVALLARIVDSVDAGSVEQVWPDAGRASLEPGSVAFVLLVGAAVQPRQEIAEAIARARRRWPAWASVVLAPVDARTWNSLVPADAPAAARRLLDRLART